MSLQDESNNPTSLENAIWNLGRAFSISAEHGRTFELSAEEREHILDIISIWAKAEAPTYPLPFLQHMAAQSTLRALAGLPSILAEVEITEPVGEDLYRKLKNLTESGVPAFEPIGELVQKTPDRMSEMVSSLRAGLASDNGRMVTSALSCLVSWPKTSKIADSPVHPPPSITTTV